MTSQAEHAEKPVSGLRPIQEAVVACGDSTVCVRAGRYATALGEVTIREDATLVVPPTPVAHVTDEPIRLTAQAPSGFATGTRLTGPDAQDINALGAFDPDSLVLRRGPGTGEVVPDSDYLVSAPHAMLGLAPDSPLAPEDTFFASYRYAFQRLDLVLVDPEGVPRYKAGMPHITTPVPPPGGLPLAHIWRPYRATTVEPEHIFPLEASAGAAAAGTTPGRLPRTLAKLRNGDQGAESTLTAFENSRKALGLDVIDLYLIHWPYPSADLYVETWKSFEKLYAEGAVRAIGVSNFLPQFLERLLAETDVVPAVNQIELHPSFQQPSTQEASRAAGIAVEAYSPLGQGKDLDDPAVTAIAERLGVSTGQVVLRWHVQQGTIVIPKSVTPERIAGNLDLFSFELSEEDMAAISALDTDERIGADPATAAFTQVRA